MIVYGIIQNISVTILFAGMVGELSYKSGCTESNIKAVRLMTEQGRSVKRALNEPQYVMDGPRMITEKFV